MAVVLQVACAERIIPVKPIVPDPTAIFAGIAHRQDEVFPDTLNALQFWRWISATPSFYLMCFSIGYDRMPVNLDRLRDAEAAGSACRSK